MIEMNPLANNIATGKHMCTPLECYGNLLDATVIK